MTKQEAVAMIDAHKNKLIHPVELLNWTWLRVIVDQMSDEDWERHVAKATEIMSQ